MDEKCRNLLQNILLMFVVLILFFAVFELVMRVVYPDETEGKFLEYDPLLGWRNKANTQGMHRIAESTSNVKINSKGVRDAEYEYSKGSGTFRILVFGDSMTWGYGVEAEERYTNVLENKLDNNVEVINMGVPGYGTDQEYLLLKEEGIKYSPNLVIFDFDIYTDACDVSNTVRYRYYSKPKFNLVGDELILTNVPVPLSPNLYQKVNRLLSGLRSYVFIRDCILSIDFIREVLSGAVQYQSNTKCEGSNQKSEDVMHLITKIISEVNNFIKSNNGKLVVVIIPNKGQVYEEGSTFQNDFLKEFGNKQNIKIIDLSPEFKESTKKGNDLYFKKDLHLNKNGHKLAAEIIYKELINDITFT